MEINCIEKILRGDTSDMFSSEGLFFVQSPNSFSIYDTNIELLKLVRELKSINMTHSRNSEFEDFNSHMKLECIIGGDYGCYILELNGSCKIDFLVFLDQDTNQSEGEYLGIKYSNVMVKDIRIERYEYNYLQHNGGFYV